ncbi:MAG: hypothetical protein ACKOA8_00825, partial [Deltaproteobacteria bacterium]
IPGLRFNVELQLPGALCASTPIAKDPKELSKSFQKKQTTQELCSVNLASARHCFEGIGNVKGSLIGAKIGERSVGVMVSQVGSADQSFGPSVQNGNPDLVVMTVEMPCSQAAQLDIARVPSPEEIKALFQNDSIPLVMQQNSAINASEEGGNRATIAATGSVDGNFIRFNSKSRFNGTSGQDVGPLSSSAGLVFDSNRIKSGDSGGSGLTCKLKDGKVEEVLYLGAISHIDVRKDRDEGKLGGVASGQSLLNLSRRFWGDERSLASRGGQTRPSNNPDHGS